MDQLAKQNERLLSNFEAKIEAKLAKKNKKKHKSKKASAMVSLPEELQAPEPEARGGGVNVSAEPVAQKVVDVSERASIDPDIDR